MAKTFHELVEQAFIQEHYATPKQRAYMVVLVFSRDIPDHLTDIVMEVFDRADLQKERASTVINLLIAQPTLNAAGMRDRLRTFDKRQRELKTKMSDVLSGKPWPDDLPFRTA